MPARKFTDSNTKVAKQKIESLFSSPLGELMKEWYEILNRVPDLQKREELAVTLLKAMERFPDNLDNRFLFDKYMITSILERWDITNNPVMIPSYSNEWAYEYRHAVRKLNFIIIRRAEGEETPYLIDYPWLCHELGHYIHIQHKKAYHELIFEEIQRYIAILKVNAIADRGMAKARAENKIKEVQDNWSNVKWLDEFAVDAIALLTCGPVYLQAYFEDHSDESLDPFLIVESHPPIELRTRVLMHNAKLLGWNPYLRSLYRQIESWNSRDDISNNRMKYFTLTDENLVEAISKATVIYCECLDLPKFTEQDIQRISESALDFESLEDGIDIMTAALVVKSTRAAVYEEWESTIFQQFVEAE